jgi:CDP-glucose 4,6-dehydratase
MGSKQGILEDLEIMTLLDETYSGKKILITGDTGFKGSWLAIWLLKLGAEVIGIGLPPKNFEDNYVVSGLSSRIEHVNGDIRDTTLIADILKEYRPDYVFHLAAQPLVLDSFKDPYQTFSTNIIGTLNVLEQIRLTGDVKAAIMVTSDKCYDNKGWIYGYRESDPLGGQDPYSASKAGSEIVINSYIQSFFQGKKGTAVASVRAGNVIGGGDWSENRIIPDCMRSLKQNQSISIRNPQAIRPWQHVLEPLYGYLLLGSALIRTENEMFQGPWNFGPLPSNTVSVETLVKELFHQAGRGSYSNSKNALEKDHHTKEAGILTLDINKAVHILDWYPVLSLHKSIQFTIDEYSIDNLSTDAVFEQRSRHIDEYMLLQLKRGE